MSCTGSLHSPQAGKAPGLGAAPHLVTCYVNGPCFRAQGSTLLPRRTTWCALCEGAAAACTPTPTIIMSIIMSILMSHGHGRRVGGMSIPSACLWAAHRCMAEQRDSSMAVWAMIGPSHANSTLVADGPRTSSWLLRPWQCCCSRHAQKMFLDTALHTHRMLGTLCHVQCSSTPQLLACSGLTQSHPMPHIPPLRTRPVNVLPHYSASMLLCVCCPRQRQEPDHSSDATTGAKAMQNHHASVAVTSTGTRTMTGVVLASSHGCSCGTPGLALRKATFRCLSHQ